MLLYVQEVSHMNNQKKNIVIIAIAAILLIAGIGGFFLYKNNQPTLQKTWSSYVLALQEKKYDTMYELLSKDTKKNISKEKFVTRNKNIYEGIDAKNINIDKMEEEDSVLSYQMKMDTIAGKLSFTHKVDMVKEDGSYKINWKDDLIFPHLDASDNVRVQELPAVRGDITDRNGGILATQGTLYQVGLVPGELSDKTASIAALATKLEISEASIEQKLAATWVKDDLFVPVKTISEQDGTTMKDELRSIPGVHLQGVEGRVYPYGKETAHLTGYVQTITAEELKKQEKEGYTANSLIGKTGLEYIYEKQLRGSNGWRIRIMNEQTSKNETLLEIANKDGETIKTTIDMKVQDALYAQLKDDAGAATAMNPKTGEVLAMLSFPAYDPNDFVLGMNTTQWDALNNNEQKPLLNRFLSTYSPGSTFKAITGAIALDTQAITLDSVFDKVKDVKVGWQKDSSWGNHRVTTTVAYEEPSTLANAMIYSDNIFFAQTADKIGAKDYASYLKKIGFDKKMDFPFGIETSSYGSDDFLKEDVNLTASGFGQGKIQVSPLHLTALYTAYVNDGTIMQPYLLFEEGKAKTWIKDAYSAETSKQMYNVLVGSMNSYGANPTNSAGKTGTAEVVKGKQEIGWISGLNDTISATIMVDNTIDNGQSHYVIPKMQAFLNALN